MRYPGRSIPARIPASILAVLFLASAAVGADPLDELGWMIGSWKRETRSGATVYEDWTRLDGRVIAGRSYRLGPEPGSAPTPLEDLLLTEMGGEVYYVAKVPENPYPVPFRLVSLEGRTAVFENPEHDFPQRIAYELGEDGTLVVTVEGPAGAEGAPRRLEFRFVRG